jgi:hypothetical protein
VTGYTRSFQSIGFKLGRYFIYGFLFPATDDHFGAKFGQAAGHTFPDALTGSGDDGDFVFEGEQIFKFLTHFDVLGELIYPRD